MRYSWCGQTTQNNSQPCRQIKKPYSNSKQLELLTLHFNTNLNFQTTRKICFTSLICYYNQSLLKNTNKIKFPDFYKIVITNAVANKLNISKELPLIEILEIKSLSTHIKNPFTINQKSVQHKKSIKH